MTDETATRFRWRLLASCAVLLGLAMTQSPGLLVPDTKLDLAIAPIDFLARAAHLWDAEGAFGQLQNQAYGYLWPMGPFFVLGDLLGLPAWVVQRLWVALVMVVAFVGAAQVSRRLGVRSDLACLLAGFAYALSPRMLTVIGPISIEAWPSALAPWVLLPLIIGAQRGSPRRAAALSALAVAMVGGVNAAATSAVLPLGALWLLTRAAGPRRRSMMIWWPVFTLLATLWWLIPLFLLGAYSPPFLDYIESSANTTFPTTLYDSLRGTSNWVPYIDASSRAGNDLLRQTHLIVNSAVVLLLGLAGLGLRRNPHRAFLVAGLISGLFLVTMGHVGQAQGWFAPQLQQLLDGALAPLRNVHKFDPVLRLPLVVGLAFTVDELVARRRTAEAMSTPRAQSDSLNMRLLIGICVLAVSAAALPAALGRLTPSSGFANVPDYWADAADWLGDEQDEGIALLVPGSSFGTYVWGTPRDEPFQSLASKPWAVRNAVPLTPAGSIRMLDEVESRLAQGRGGAGLAPFLTRAGVSHVVVRNDLRRSADIPDPVMVHQAVEGSPGLEKVMSFGPSIGGQPRIEGDLGKAMINGGWQAEYPAIEIYAVEREPSRVSRVEEPRVVVGGPEDLADLAELGILDGDPVRLAVDQSEEVTTEQVILTDGLRAVERNFGRLHDATSETTAAGEARDLPSRSANYEIGDPERWSTRAELVGARAVTASSSQADANAFGAVVPGAMPYAALDDDPATLWVSALGADQWWQLDFDSARSLGELSITIGNTGREVLQVVTDDWASPSLTFEPGGTRTITIPGTARFVRIIDKSGRTDNRVELAEISSDSLDVRRVLRMPDLPEGSAAPSAIVMRRLGEERSGCARVGEAVRCRVGQARTAEEPQRFSRRFSLGTSMSTTPKIVVSAMPGQSWDDYLLTDQPVSAVASSTMAPDQRDRAAAAIDGDPGTSWIAALDDPTPELRLAWLGRRTISGVGLSIEPGTAARLPESLQLSWPGGTRTVRLGGTGQARFPAIRTSQLSLAVIDAEPATDLDFAGSASFVPVGISEIRIQGLPYLPLALPTDERTTPCGSGPAIRINSVTYQTKVTASPAELLRGGTGVADLCSDDAVRLASGTNEVEVAGATAFVVDSVVLVSTLDAAVEGATDPPVASSIVSATELRIEASEEDSHVVTHMNANPGWTAQQDGNVLEAGVFDGWRQGWAVPGGSDEAVVARFGPDRVYRFGLMVGAVALLVLLVLLVRPGASRRRASARQEPPALGGRHFAPAVVVGFSLLSGALLAGPVGVGIAAAATGVGALVHSRAPVTGSTWLIGVLLFPAATAYLVRPWGGTQGWAGSFAWPHYLVLAACSVLMGVHALASSRRNRSANLETGNSIVQ